MTSQASVSGTARLLLLLSVASTLWTAEAQADSKCWLQPVEIPKRNCSKKSIDRACFYKNDILYTTGERNRIYWYTSSPPSESCDVIFQANWISGFMVFGDDLIVLSNSREKKGLRCSRLNLKSRAVVQTYLHPLGSVLDGHGDENDFTWVRGQVGIFSDKFLLVRESGSDSLILRNIFDDGVYARLSQPLKQDRLAGCGPAEPECHYFLSSARPNVGLFLLTHDGLTYHPISSLDSTARRTVWSSYKLAGDTLFACLVDKAKSSTLAFVDLRSPERLDTLCKSGTFASILAASPKRLLVAMDDQIGFLELP